MFSIHGTQIYPRAKRTKKEKWIETQTFVFSEKLDYAPDCKMRNYKARRLNVNDIKELGFGD